MASILLQLLGKLLPPIITVAAVLFYGSKVAIEPSLQNMLLSAILGFAISVWISLFNVERTSERTSADIAKSSSLNLYVATGKEIEAIVKSIYETEGGVIYSTSINYSPEDIRISDSTKTDWASPLYAQETATVFNRIISIGSDRDREWVGNMLRAKRNQNYDLRVAEGVSDNVLFPNFVIVRKNDQYRVFMSFRAHSPDGRFAFVTQDRRFAEGVWQYASRFHASLPTAEVILDGDKTKSRRKRQTGRQ